MAVQKRQRTIVLREPEPERPRVLVLKDLLGRDLPSDLQALRRRQATPRAVRHWCRTGWRREEHEGKGGAMHGDIMPGRNHRSILPCVALELSEVPRDVFHRRLLSLLHLPADLANLVGRELSAANRVNVRVAEVEGVTGCAASVAHEAATPIVAMSVSGMVMFRPWWSTGALHPPGNGVEGYFRTAAFLGLLPRAPHGTPALGGYRAHILPPRGSRRVDD